MPRILCRICRYATPISAHIAKVHTIYLHCTQGVGGAPHRVECPVFVREPGADDEWPNVRLRGRLPTRYPIIAASRRVLDKSARAELRTRRAKCAG